MTTGQPFTFLFAPTLNKGSTFQTEEARPLRRYLEQALGRPVTMLSPSSYTEAMAALREGRADAAMLGDFASRQAQRAGGVEPLVAPIASDEDVPTYRSVVVTRIDTGIHDLAGISGHTLGLVDTHSTSGYLVPRAMLREARLDPDHDVSIRLFGRHRAVVEAVIRGEIPVGAMHEAGLRPPALDAGPEYARLRVLARSRPIPLGPLVVRTSLDEPTRHLLASALIRIHEADPVAAALLIRHGHRFTVATPRNVPTLKSIAALAGVSYATVSRVVNNSGDVAPETARRVNAIITETGFVPNGNARQLQRQLVPLIGLLVRLDTTDPHHSDTVALIALLQARLSEAGLPLVVCPIGGSISDDRVVELIRDHRFGAIVITDAHVADPYLHRLARTGHLIVAVSAEAAPQGVIRATPDTVARTLAPLLRQR